MQNDIRIFDFDGSDSIRTAVTEAGEPVVIAADVCRIAGHTQPSRALERLADHEKGVISIHTSRCRQDLLYVTESGFYALVLSFRLRKNNPRREKLEQFRLWVTSEVIPSIRRTGRYECSPTPVALPAPIPLPCPSTGSALALDPRLREMRLLYAVVEGQIENERRLALVEPDVADANAKASTALTRLEHVEAKAAAALADRTGDSGYLAILGYGRLHRHRLDEAEAARHGKRVSAICRARDIPIKFVSHEKYGTVNTYPTDVLDEYFSGLN